MTRKVWSVSDVVSDVNDMLRGLGELWVEGEVSNLRPSGAGHVYFSIKDEGAQLSVALFAREARALKFRIENGQQLVLRGRLGIYEQRGQFQLIASHAEPAGIGALQLAFEQLKEKLAKEGLFDEARKKPLPLLPGRIAVVTSPTGAAVRDVLNVLGRRFAGLSIQVYPVRVQGDAAAGEIVRALGHLSRWNRHDVILLCRGGGSIEDLQPFNEEIVARAIASCGIPVITGVGHETDFTIADFVADHRAPTPSAAAEIVIRAKDEIAMRVDIAERRIRDTVLRLVRQYRSDLRHLVSTDGLMGVPLRVERTRQQLQSTRYELMRVLDRHAKVLRRRLTALDEPLLRMRERLEIPERIHKVLSMRASLERRMVARLESSRARLTTEAARLEAVSPLSVLSRGYAIAYQFDGRKKRPIQDASRVAIGEKIEIQLRRGTLGATVDHTTLGVESIWPENETRPDTGATSAGDTTDGKGKE
jgi:exodeoxyribonuclease VII large subunit